MWLKEKSPMENKFMSLCCKALEETHLDLYDLDFNDRSKTLRLFIIDPKTDTAIIDDCVKVDHLMTDYLEEDWVPESLVLEVSSPGVFRKLNSVKHFESVIGKEIEIKLSKKLGEYTEAELQAAVRRSKKVRVKLLSVNEDGIEVEVKESKIIINYSDIKEANLEN